MEKCTRIVLADRACNSMISEVVDRGSQETGGILLGTVVGSIWYVLEAVDPGPWPMLSPKNLKYVNHLTKVLSRQYRIELKVLGRWRRDLENEDTLSSTKQVMNSVFSLSPAAPEVLALINIGPASRLTVYHLSDSQDISKVNYDVANDLVPENLFEYNHAEEIRKINLVQYCMPYVSNFPLAHLGGTNGLWQTSKRLLVMFNYETRHERSL
ncbi:hypothetical protein EXU57_23225 [Segetibacter sp. 3557_3]|uniref:hypothetical protein n=1 Tax=Segetibacter sp. 3557_3 TaxID=2547429 RepID=UPI001058706A|nr:hypothetical protein [Segetibacter sp. 3557_3]TDH18512.1 hypothetical protein EXU57_23225 [Segetibacter sp. 3557_3]